MIESPPRFFMRRYERWDQPFVLDLMRQSLGESSNLRRSEEVWTWKHVDNWFGASHVMVATSQLVPIVGLRAFMRWRFRVSDEVYSAVRAVDTATHPDFQRRGMFSQLTSRAVVDVRNDGTDIVFNTPNDKSRPGYLKLGWRPVGDVQPLVKILNHRNFAAGMVRYKLGRNGHSELNERDFIKDMRPAPVDSLLARDGIDTLILANEHRWRGFIRTDVDAAFLRWRYQDHPSLRYFSAWIEHAGHLEAAAIFRLNRRFGLREIVLSELMLERSDQKLVDELIERLRDRVWGDYLIGYAGARSPDAVLLAGAGFRRFPIAAMTLTANPLTTRVANWDSLEDWGLGLGDLEYF